MNKFKPGDVIGIKGWVGYYTVLGTVPYSDISEPKADWYTNPDHNTRLVYIMLRNNVKIHKLYKQGNEAIAFVNWVDGIAFKVRESIMVKGLYGE